MALRSVKRVTFSLPKTTVIKLEMRVPKSKRSGFLAKLIEGELDQRERNSFEEYCGFWDDIAKSAKSKSSRSVVDLIREDRKSH